ncbi:unnamed protein product [Prorocentrum cordatum]|uniref:Uncharacterized protein n=1 Tax=Prorocentrum cordatum TaxID=2364126 RepID=A0ABN9RS45_9DINO|nr:unnamed protein product [Polarella glacialis]
MAMLMLLQTDPELRWSTAKVQQEIPPDSEEGTATGYLSPTASKGRGENRKYLIEYPKLQRVAAHRLRGHRGRQEPAPPRQARGRAPFSRGRPQRHSLAHGQPR